MFDGGHPDGDQDDSCGQCLMTIVARGTAIITELYRLVELIPEPFADHNNRDTSTKQQPSRFVDKDKRWTLSDIVCDFSYFNRAEAFEARIESEPTLKQADEEFCDTYVDILTRFYLTFESVQRHAQDLNRFVVDLEDEVYIGQSLESLLVNTEARQLLCEAYFQLGYMLLLVDLSFEGRLREQLIVAYYRYSSYKSSPGTNLDETCKLMRQTGFLSSAKQRTTSAGGIIGSLTPSQRPVGYPENYFARVGVNQSVVNTLIAKLQTVDIYNQTLCVFPHPDHRSNALAQQAAVLYVLLYFCPNILKTQRSRMREITDKFFPDNWVLNLYMGELVNLLHAWDPYHAARESLGQIYDSECVRSLASNFGVRFNRASKQLDEYLVEGWLCEESFIEHQVRIMNCIREANISLRWLLLHSRMRPAWCAASGSSNSKSQQVKVLHAIVAANQPSARKLCEFLQNLCTLEKKLSALYEQVIVCRRAQMDANKARACDMLDELVSIFNDSKPMRWVQAGANSGLAQILGEARAGLDSLDLHNDDHQTQDGPKPPAARRDTIIRLVNRIESARESYSDGKSLQVVQLFMDTKESLLRLLRYLDLSQDFKVVLQSVSDFSYAWQLMDELFTRDLQQIIKDNPLNLLGFEAIILKLTAAFEGQLVRVQQVGAQTDLISVSQYYSSKLVSYIRQVLQIIPATILELITCIIEIQTDQLRRNQHQQRSLPSASTGAAMPSKIALDNLRDYAQPEVRARMLQLTCKISHYARGMMAMPSTAIGLIRINAKRMLEDGLRRELNEKMRRVIEETLHFGSEPGGTRAGKQSDLRHLQDRSRRLMAKLEELAITLGGYKRAFEYTQDFLAIYGLRMWQEELAGIVRAHVDRAVSEAMDHYHHDQQVDQRSHGPAKSVMSFSTLVKSTPVVEPSGRTNQEKKMPRSFMTSLLEELLKITCARETIYDEQTSAWYNRKQEQVLDGTKVCKLITASLGVAGLNGLDRLCATRLMAELEQLARGEDASPQWQVFASLDQMSGDKLLRNDELAPSSVDSRRQQMLSLFFALIGGGSGSGQNHQRHQSSERLIGRLLLVGQLQTLRLCIACVLSANCRYEARHLYGCLSAVNDILLATLKHGASGRRSRSAESSASAVPNQQKRTATAVNSGSSSSSNSLPAGAEDCLSEANERARTTMSSGPAQLDESQLVFELANHLEWIGLSDPRSKIYTMALHQRGRLEQQQQRQQQVADGEQHFATSGSTALTKTGNAAIIHRILEESLRINHQQQQQRPMQPKGSAASQGFRALELNAGGGGGGTHAGQAMLDGQPLYLGLQTLLNHIGRAQVVVVAPVAS